MPQLPTDTLLYEKRPLVVNPVMAEKLGINEAIIIQQVYYWQDQNQTGQRNFKDGHYWTYNTYEEWKVQFPWCSVATIKRAISHLEGLGLLISGNYNKIKLDRTKWYRVNFDHELLRREPSIGANCADGGGNMHRPIPETTTETTTNIDTDESTEAAPPPAKKTRAKKAPLTIPDAHQAVINYIAALQGRPNVINNEAQAKHLANLLSKGVTLEQVRGVADIMYADPYWKKEGFTLGNILSNIDRYLGKLAKKTQVYADPSDLPPDQYDLIPERFPGEKQILQQLKERGFVWNTLTGKYERPS